MGLQLPKRARRIGLASVLTAGSLLLGACSSEDKAQIRRLAQPVGVTDRTDVMHSLWMWSWLAAILTGILVWGLIFYACFKYRRRHDDEIPVQTRYNLPIEILYTVAPVVMVVVFFFFTVQAQDKVLADDKKPDHVVYVVGQQWSWTFNYTKEPEVGGQTVYDAGTTAYRPTLVLPVNESVDFELRSPDVIHSFWVPAFLMKMDIVPGLKNHFELTPTREGTYVGRCAELCGAYHSRMLFNVKVVSHADYATYLKSLQGKGQTGLALGGADARTQAGLEQNGAGE